MRAPALFNRGDDHGEEMVARMQDTMLPMPPLSEELRRAKPNPIIAAWVDAGMPSATAAAAESRSAPVDHGPGCTADYSLKRAV